VTDQQTYVDPDGSTAGGFTDFTARADEGPVVMLNLLQFRPDGGAERYGEYGAAVTPILEELGARVVFSAAASPTLIGPPEAERWDLMMLVEYPSRQVFMDMVGSPEYQAIAHLRTEALDDSRLVPLDPSPLPAASDG
jgi:uncharacterized protein (DUF1330 family)